MPELEVLLAFVERFGVPVFPCRPGTKKPATKNGFKDATTDPDEIRACYQHNPKFNWGMPTGTVSGFNVLDCDNKHGKDGSAALSTLEAKYGKLPDTPVVLTPSGGFHYWFRCNGTRLKSDANGTLGVGLDTRGEGGYVVIPPSVIEGREYTWEASSDPAEVGFADTPKWLIELVPYVEKTVPDPDRLIVKLDAVEKIESVVAGTSLHDSLRDLAAHYVALNMPGPEIIKVLELSMLASQAPRDQRWKDRFAEIPKLVDSAMDKYGQIPESSVAAPDSLDSAAYYGLAGEIVRARRPPKSLSRLAQWALRVEARCGHNKACVALANKLARTQWAVWRYERAYDPEKGPALAPSL